MRQIVGIMLGGVVEGRPSLTFRPPFSLHLSPLPMPTNGYAGPLRAFRSTVILRRRFIRIQTELGGWDGSRFARSTNASLKRACVPPIP